MASTSITVGVSAPSQLRFLQPGSQAANAAFVQLGNTIKASNPSRLYDAYTKTVTSAPQPQIQSRPTDQNQNAGIQGRFTKAGARTVDSGSLPSVQSKDAALRQLWWSLLETDNRAVFYEFVLAFPKLKDPSVPSYGTPSKLFDEDLTFRPRGKVSAKYARGDGLTEDTMVDAPIVKYSTQTLFCHTFVLKSPSQNRAEDRELFFAVKSRKYPVGWDPEQNCWLNKQMKDHLDHKKDPLRWVYRIIICVDAQNLITLIRTDDHVGQTPPSWNNVVQKLFNDMWQWMDGRLGHIQAGDMRKPNQSTKAPALKSTTYTPAIQHRVVTSTPAPRQVLPSSNGTSSAAPRPGPQAGYKSPYKEMTTLVKQESTPGFGILTPGPIMAPQQQGFKGAAAPTKQTRRPSAGLPKGDPKLVIAPNNAVIKKSMGQDLKRKAEQNLDNTIFEPIAKRPAISGQSPRMIPTDSPAPSNKLEPTVLSDTTYSKLRQHIEEKLISVEARWVTLSAECDQNADKNGSSISNAEILETEEGRALHTERSMLHRQLQGFNTFKRTPQGHWYSFLTPRHSQQSGVTIPGTLAQQVRDTQSLQQPNNASNNAAYEHERYRMQQAQQSQAHVQSRPNEHAPQNQVQYSYATPNHDTLQRPIQDSKWLLQQPHRPTIKEEHTSYPDQQMAGNIPWQRPSNQGVPQHAPFGQTVYPSQFVTKQMGNTQYHMLGYNAQDFASQPQQSSQPNVSINPNKRRMSNMATNSGTQSQQSLQTKTPVTPSNRILTPSSNGYLVSQYQQTLLPASSVSNIVPRHDEIMLPTPILPTMAYASAAYGIAQNEVLRLVGGRTYSNTQKQILSVPLPGPKRANGSS